MGALNILRKINRAAVIGSGVMGAGIAAHLANAGIKVLLLDIIPTELTEAEKAKGLTLERPETRNRLATAGLAGALKAKPAAFYHNSYADLITPGNLVDDIAKIKDCDWVIEVIIENMDIKKNLLSEKIGPNISPDAILSTNTSGLSINEMAQALPPDLRKNFLVTHFFNPPRYMRLMEIVPCGETDPQVVEQMAAFIEKRLGKGVVYAKDTPNFIGNRIGVYTMLNAMRHMEQMGLTVEEVDAIAGPASGRPKSAAFRTADMVGIDTLAHVAQNSYDNLPDDEERDAFQTPEMVTKMIENGLLGAKVGKGFYKKEKENGKSVIYHYDPATGDYKLPEKPKFASVQAARLVDDPAERIKGLVNAKDKAGEFAWKNLRDTLIYAINRIPEIADDIVNIDNAMKWGYNWELGPFEMIDAIGVKEFVSCSEKDGVTVPDVLKKIDSFYKFEEGARQHYSIQEGAHQQVPLSTDEVNLEIIKHTGGVVEKSADCSILDIGDGVFCFQFHSKMNTIGGDILTKTHNAIKRAEDEGVGLVIGNNGQHFSAGANIMLIAVAIAEGAYEDIDMMIRMFQKATMAVKYSKVPVVAAPFNMALGGGCEYVLHSDAVNVHGETYMGLVEVGVGLLPAGGGTKEMAMRAIVLADKYSCDVSPYIKKYFENIGLGKVSSSAVELFHMGYLRNGDSVTMNSDSLITDAKQKVIALSHNYRPSKPAENLKAPGTGVAAGLRSQLWNMKMGGYATDYEEILGRAIANVITGGKVPGGTIITEQHLLDLEREAFLKLCGNKETMERIQHMLKKGKPLRN